MHKDDDEVRPLPGVQKVKDSLNWQFIKKLPKNLQGLPRYAGKTWAYRGTLGTTDLVEANKRAAAILQGLIEEWQQAEAASKPTDPAAVTPAQVQAIAQRVYASVLEEDERLRRDPVALAQELARWWDRQERARKLSATARLSATEHPYRARPVPACLTEEGIEDLKHWLPGQGLPEPLWELLKERNQSRAQTYRASLARRADSSFILLADKEARKLGVNITAEGWDSPEARPIKDACHRAMLAALEALAKQDEGELPGTPPGLLQGHAPAFALSPAISIGHHQQQPSISPNKPNGPKLGAVVSAFLKQAPENGYKRKLKAACSMLVEHLGEGLPVDTIRQASITEFLRLTQRLPLDWHHRMQKGASFAELVKDDHPKCISPTTYEGSYRITVGKFLKWAGVEYGDQGFPRTLTTDHVDYGGTRGAGEEQQRNFKDDELRRLFASQQYRELAAAPDREHCYWLPLVALYTGARARELCQINPQTDFGTSADGIPFLHLTDKTPADEGVKKQIKTGEARHVPVHPELVRLGFLQYVQKVKQQGARRLFPGFGVKHGDAGERARDWFTDFMRETGLRDETPGAMLTGMHAFRKTFITRGKQRGLTVEPITGHADGTTSAVVRQSYMMEEVALKTKLTTITGITFDAVPPVHVSVKLEQQQGDKQAA